MHAFIVIDLGFGDAGKGLITDFLVRQKKAGLVVRYNGGPQAGHNVVTPDRRHHTFSQFGSGSFVPGVKTYLSKYMVIHPTALLLEGEALISNGAADVFSRLRISRQSLVVTPFHQAANRIHELMRGAARHGSCGVGVGEVVEDAQSASGDVIRAGDLCDLPILRKELRCIQDRKRSRLVDLYSEKSLKHLAAAEWQYFEREDILETWLSAASKIANLGLVASDEVLTNWFHQTETVVFEGSQGILLDAGIGFHPFTSWTSSTASNALALINDFAPDAKVTKIGVARNYSVRHGPGPLPTQTDELIPLVREHNRWNPWQGEVRYGWFDAVMMRYALNAAGPLDALAITHFDLLPKLKSWKYCFGYKNLKGLEYYCSKDSNGIISELGSQNFLSLEQRVIISKNIQRCRPVYKYCEADEQFVINKIEELTTTPVDIISTGPCSLDVKMINQDHIV